ncbi:MAG: aminoacyl-tRNA hydrolase [Rhodospirillales bacterium]|nr:aminoacyl-tRNA hydrolase [Rhodospirillales bacterium]|tara:strand:- start:4951 stop:5382 length:432 start_codon:yes stop_codon:yes gene_type:complete
MPDDLVFENLMIPYTSLVVTYIRASGPGGQNVNKISTAAQLRFDAKHCSAMDPNLFKRLQHIAGSRMTSSGVIVITAKRFRSRERNREDAVERLRQIIKNAIARPKYRHPIRVGKVQKQRRLEKKRRNGNVKKGRSRIRMDDL